MAWSSSSCGAEGDPGAEREHAHLEAGVRRGVGTASPWPSSIKPGERGRVSAIDTLTGWVAAALFGIAIATSLVNRLRLSSGHSFSMTWFRAHNWLGIVATLAGVAHCAVVGGERRHFPPARRSASGQVPLRWGVRPHGVCGQWPVRREARCATAYPSQPCRHDVRRPRGGDRAHGAERSLCRQVTRRCEEVSAKMDRPAVPTSRRMR